MPRYIGLDVHAQSCTVAVVGESGKRLSCQVVETSKPALLQALRAIPSPRHLCIEEGTHSAWLHEILSGHVAELVVTMPPKREGAKNDERDAFRLAEDLRRGAIETRVFKAPTAVSRLRNAVRGYLLLTRDSTRAKNRLRAVYRSRGIQVGSEIYDDARALSEKKLPAQHHALASLFGAEVEALCELQQRALEELREQARQHPAVARVATAPGLSTIRAATVVAVVVTPHRFRTKRQFWAYCGLAIVTRSSADWERKDGHWQRSQIALTRGLNRNRNAWLKDVFKGAATTVIGKMPDHPLCEAYQRLLTGGTRPNLAKLTIARRIAAAVLAMWKQQEAYDPAKHRRQPAVVA